MSMVPTASAFPGFPSMPQRKPGQLDGPPPAPGQPQLSPGGGGEGMPGMPGMGMPGMAGGAAPSGDLPLPTAGQDPRAVVQEALRAVSEMVLALDRTLLIFAQSMPDSADEFSQARQLIEAGVKKYVSTNVGNVGDAGMLPAATPTETGPQFPGGGFDSGSI